MNRTRLNAAAGTLQHRGPDAEGQTVRELRLSDHQSVSIGLAHTRLSILDVDPRSNQPFVRRNLALVYNGEIYNFKAIRSALRAAGTQFTTDGDTEVLLEAIAAEGPSALSKMSGQWAFALLDLAQGTVFASRDRFGKKPLFCYHDSNLFILASTVRSISTYLRQSPTFTESFVRTFLRWGFYYTEPQESPFERISQIGAGTTCLFDLRSWKARVHKYFEVTNANDHIESDNDIAQVLNAAVRARLISDRPVGLLLSGGVDSSLILSVLKAGNLQDQVTCFIGDTGVSADANYAQQAAAACGLKPQVVKIDYSSTALDNFLAVCGHQERPFPLHGNLMAMPQMYKEIASTDIRVVLDGTGADEIFGGYWDRQFPFALRDALRTGDVRWLTKMIASTPASQIRRLLIACRSALLKGRNAPTDLSGKLVDPLEDPTLTFDHALVRDVEAGRLADWIWQNDRNSMMYGVEARSPFLDVSCSHFIGSGYRQKFNGRYNKLELRHAFTSFIELPTQWRVQKQGFRWSANEFIRQNAASLGDLISASNFICKELLVSTMSDLKDSVEVSAQTRNCIVLAAVEHEMARL